MASATIPGGEPLLGPGESTSRPAVRFWPTNVVAALAVTLYIATVGVGLWAAFDPAAAWRRLMLIGLGLALMALIWAAGRWWGERGLGWAGMGCALAAGLLGAYFLLTFDWAAKGINKLPVLYQLGLWIQAGRPALPAPENLHPNVAASGLVLLICLGAGGLIWVWQRGRRWPRGQGSRRWRFWRGFLAGVTGLALAIAGLALLVTMARGAWLGLLAGVLAAGYLRWRNRSQTSRRTRRWVGLLAVIAILLLGAALWLAIASPNLIQPTRDDSNTVVNRLALWQHAFDLIRDYPFTGSGLGSTMMVHAVYVMLIHVGFIPHLHNLFLQIAIEQGVFGLAAFLMLLSAAAWRAWAAARSSDSVLALATVAALTAMIVHGLADAGLYASRMVPLMFVPIGFGLGLQAAAGGDQKSEASSRGSARGVGGQRAEGGGRRVHRTYIARTSAPWTVVALALLAGVLLFLPVTRAAWQANLGAVEQTRVELKRYHWPSPRFIDEVRRDSASELAPAIAHYRAALALSPGQAVANRRLGQIELSLGDYEAARRHLQAAYQTAPGQQATRASLGESYAIAGETEQAVGLWRRVSNQLWWDFDWLLQQSVRLRYGWYRTLDEDDHAEGVRQAGMEMGFKMGQ